jgi:ParB family transcriptional regulator, chromosome partitioning protein
MAQRKRGLGRGLEALIQSGSHPDAAAQVLEIGVDAIAPNPFQPRTQLTETELAGLVDSIREHGVIQPVIVTESDEPGAYRLIAGERRWRAAQRAGLDVVPAIVRESTPRSMLELALIENIQRADLNVIEEASAYRQLIEEFGMTQAELAARVGKSRSAITNAIRVLGAPREIQDALLAGDITEGHARALLGLPSSAEQIAGLRLVHARNLSVRQTERLVREQRQKPKPESDASERARTDPEQRRFEESLQRALGARVELRPGRSGGRLVIHYHSDDELNGIYERLVGRNDL